MLINVCFNIVGTISSFSVVKIKYLICLLLQMFWQRLVGQGWKRGLARDKTQNFRIIIIIEIDFYKMRPEEVNNPEYKDVITQIKAIK